MPELRRRVDELPPELGDMFQHMLNGINPRHREQGARLLKICHTYIQAYQDGIQALGLALIDDFQSGTGHGAVLKCLDRPSKLSLCEELEGRLRSRCGGLLEFQHEAWSPNCFCGSGLGSFVDHRDLVDVEVSFMHRSVFEFLSSDNTWELACLQVPDNNVDVATALSMYGLQLAMQSLSLPSPSPDQIWRFLIRATLWNIEVVRRNPTQPAYFLESLHLVLNAISHLKFDDQLLSALARGALFHGTELSMAHTLIPLALKVGAVGYVQTHPNFPAVLAHDRTSCGCLPLLLQVVRQGPTSEGLTNLPVIFPDVELDLYSQRKTIELLLCSGSDPNEPYENHVSPWEDWVTLIGIEGYNDLQLLEVLGMAEMFLDFGADIAKFGLKDWVTGHCLGFIASQQVRTKAKELLLRTQGSVATEGGSLPRKRALSVGERSGKRARTGF